MLILLIQNNFEDFFEKQVKKISSGQGIFQ